METEIRAKRKYELRRRAERQAETRGRIVNAAMELHATVGPARTTISAIAGRAGVDRHTVYSHFPDARSLFGACSTRGRALYPWPDPEPWRRIRDPEARMRAALADIYAYYARTEALWTNILRDAELMPLVREALEQDFRYLAEACELLAAGWGARGRRTAELMAALGHSVAFSTWRSLVREQGLGPDRAIEILIAMVGQAARD